MATPRTRLHIKDIRPGTVLRDRGNRSPTFRVTGFEQGWLSGTDKVLIQFVRSGNAGRATMKHMLKRCYVIRQAA
jgi:hypothetical protein